MGNIISSEIPKCEILEILESNTSFSNETISGTVVEIVLLGSSSTGKTTLFQQILQSQDMGGKTKEYHDIIITKIRFNVISVILMLGKFNVDQNNLLFFEEISKFNNPIELSRYENDGDITELFNKLIKYTQSVDLEKTLELLKKSEEYFDGAEQYFIYFNTVF